MNELDPELYLFLRKKLIGRKCVFVTTTSVHVSESWLYQINNIGKTGKQIRTSSMVRGTNWPDASLFRLPSKAEIKEGKRKGVNEKCRTLEQVIHDLTEEFNAIKANDMVGD
jgi:hypothetical protein